MVLYSTCLVASVISDFGLRNTVYVDTSTLAGDDLKRYVRVTYRYRTVAGALSAAMVGLFAAVVEDQAGIVAVGWGVIAATMAVADTSAQFMRGRGHADAEAITNVVERIVVVLALLLLWVLGVRSLPLVVAVLALSAAARAMALRAVVLRSIGHPGHKVTVTAVMRVLRRNWASGLVLLVFLLYLRSPVLLAPLVGLRSDVAFIGVLATLREAVLFIPSVLCNAVLPTFLPTGELNLWDPSAIRRMLKIVAGAASIVALVMVIAPSLVLLAFGDDFQQYTLVLRLVAITIPLACCNALLRFIAIARGDKLELLRAVGSIVVVELGLLGALAMVDGLRGVAVAMVLGEIALFAATSTALRRSARPGAAAMGLSGAGDDRHGRLPPQTTPSPCSVGPLTRR